mmetsp:Transcript_24774/g.98343  ORF Transcript_24774/g.98343 Transcript_24774/m.98343 type:complete len:370 (+) Transcript_24774:88-1197(+)
MTTTPPENINDARVSAQSSVVFCGRTVEEHDCGREPPSVLPLPPSERVRSALLLLNDLSFVLSPQNVCPSYHSLGISSPRECAFRRGVDPLRHKEEVQARHHHDDPGVAVCLTQLSCTLYILHSYEGVTPQAASLFHLRPVPRIWSVEGPEEIGLLVALEDAREKARLEGLEAGLVGLDVVAQLAHVGRRGVDARLAAQPALAHAERGGVVGEVLERGIDVVAEARTSSVGVVSSALFRHARRRPREDRILVVVVATPQMIVAGLAKLERAERRARRVAVAQLDQTLFERVDVGRRGRLPAQVVEPPSRVVQAQPLVPPLEALERRRRGMMMMCIRGGGGLRDDGRRNHRAGSRGRIFWVVGRDRGECC